MKRPLELTIYPYVDRWVEYTMVFLGKEVSGSSREYGYETPRGIFAGDEYPEKRLTDAELAAEYWRHNGDTDAVCEGLRVKTFGGLIANGLLAEDLMKARLATLERFATLPHYDEDAA